jgi:hypothetical protein
MENIPSTFCHDSIISHEHIIPIEQIEEPHAHNPDEDDNVVTQRTTKSFDDDFIVYFMDDTPRTIEEAFLSPDADLWKEAIRSEMDSIMSNGTWEVIKRPYGCKPRM